MREMNEQIFNYFDSKHKKSFFQAAITLHQEEGNFKNY
jgi:hypothetical protein